MLSESRNATFYPHRDLDGEPEDHARHLILEWKERHHTRVMDLWMMHPKGPYPLRGDRGVEQQQRARKREKCIPSFLRHTERWIPHRPGIQGHNHRLCPCHRYVELERVALKLGRKIGLPLINRQYSSAVRSMTVWFRFRLSQEMFRGSWSVNI